MNTKSVGAAGEREQVLAVCWFRREDYDAARAVMSDPERLYDGYDEWLREAQHFETEMSGRGVRILRIRFDGEAFGLFCLTRGVDPDGAARASWAAEEAARRFQTRPR